MQSIHAPHHAMTATSAPASPASARPDAAAALNHHYSKATPRLFAAFTAVAMFGWLVSTFLTGIHFWALPLPAGVEAQGSLSVITSQWAYVGGVPLALLGALYYLAVVLAAGLWWQTRHPLILKALTPVTAVGVAASAVFVYLQLGPIGAICPFCMMSAGASVVLFAIELAILRGSELPPVRTLIADARGRIAGAAFAWPAIAATLAALVLLAFYAATLAPIPGN